jgi:pimeloyl-ACP methyl ester carboxylesterase
MAMHRAYEERYCRSDDGLRLYVRDYPGPEHRAPVLCLPGLTRNCHDFEALAARLAPQRRVLCPDFRGRGESQYDPDWTNYNPARYAADTWGLLEELQIEHVIVVGTSLGGWLSMLMGHQQPGRVAAVVMNDIGPEVNPDGIARVVDGAGRLDRVPTLDKAVAETKRFYQVAFPDWDDEQWRAFVAITYRETGQGDYDLNFDRNIGHAAREGVSGLDIDPWTLFDSMVDVPALLIHGALSDILTEDIIRKMCDRKPDLRIARVPNRGHAPLLDEKEAIDAISRFMQDV